MTKTNTRVPRSRAATFVALAALAVAGIGAQGASAASVNIKAKPDAITYSQGSVKIKGFLVVDPGASAAGRTLKLYERPYPYRSASLIATTVTDAEGHYVFDVEPDVNSTYKVAINEPDVVARSKSQQVVVFAQGKLKVKTTRDRHIASRFKLKYSPSLTTNLAHRKVLWYFNEVGKPRFSIKDKTRTKAPRKGLLVGKSRFKAPSGDYRFRVTYCIDVPNQKDIGVGPPGASRSCPHSFPAATSRALSTAGDSAAAVGTLTEG